MNKTNIEWTNFSWNPVTGCDHGCWYCYAKKLAQRFPKVFPNGFKPTFYPERLKEPWEHRKPVKIFCCSVSDLFAPWTSQQWRWRVLGSASQCPVKHIFQFLTKNPELIDTSIKYPDNFWMGTTVTCENGDWRNLEYIKKVRCGVRFASFEPLLGMLPWEVDLRGLDWIIIGKLTGSRKVQLDPEWVRRILKEAYHLGIPVFIKNNLLKDLTFPESWGAWAQEIKKNPQRFPGGA